MKGNFCCKRVFAWKLHIYSSQSIVTHEHVMVIATFCVILEQRAIYTARQRHMRDGYVEWGFDINIHI